MMPTGSFVERNREANRPPASRGCRTAFSRSSNRPHVDRCQDHDPVGRTELIGSECPNETTGFHGMLLADLPHMAAQSNTALGRGMWLRHNGSGNPRWKERGGTRRTSEGGPCETPMKKFPSEIQGIDGQTDLHVALGANLPPSVALTSASGSAVPLIGVTSMAFCSTACDTSAPLPWLVPAPDHRVGQPTADRKTPRPRRDHGKRR